MARPRLHIWYLAARPKTLAAAISPVIIGSAMAYADSGFHLLSAAVALIGAVLIQIGTNLANDYFDCRKGTDTSGRLGPLRVTQAGLVDPSAMRKGIGFVFGVALLLGVYLVWRGGWPIAAIGLLSILCGLLYTGGPYPLGYHGLGDVFVLIFFGPVAVGGTYYVQTLDITAAVLLAGVAPGLFSVAILTVNNLRDIDNDRATGKKTLAVRCGRKFSVAEYTGSLLVGCLIPVLLVLALDGNPCAMVSAVTFLFALPAIRTVAVRRGAVLNDTLASTGRLLFVFSVLFSTGWII